MKHILFALLYLICACSGAPAAQNAQPTISKTPYISALAIDAATGDVLFEDNADARVYPASVLKLMDLYIVLTRIEAGKLSLDEMVQVTPEAARMGGSQVYLDPREQFSVDELLYALMVQSANDAATALAIHISGSKQAFVELMNSTAKQLGMNNTTFHTEHGLPPAKGQKPDITTARDMATLSQELLKRPETLKYTSTKTRGFRNDTFTMRNHNHLLGQAPGVDGLKTGYFGLAGFSTVITAPKDGQRVIVLVMGSKDRKERDAKAMEIMHKTLTALPAAAAVEQAVPPAPADQGQVSAAAPADAGSATGDQQKDVPAAAKEKTAGASSGWGKFFLGLGAGLFVFLAIVLVAGRILQQRRNGNRHIRR